MPGYEFGGRTGRKTQEVKQVLRTQCVKQTMDAVPMVQILHGGA